MKEVAIAARPRVGKGKGPARRVRMAGDIPAVIYGPETDAMPVVVNDREFRAVMRSTSGTTVINLDIEGKPAKVVLRDIQRDPVSSKVVHLDFYAISENRPLDISIPLKMVGLPRGVKDEGGIMQITMQQIDVSCLPKNIPDEIEVDVSDLGIGESIHVEDLSIPDVQIRAEGRRTVVVIGAPSIMKATAEEGEEAEGEEGAEGEAEAAAVEGEGEGEGKGEEKKEG